MVHELLIYMHGMTTDVEVESHEAEYNALHRGITRRMPATSSWHEAQPCFVEWGWNHEIDPRPRGHENLAAAQQQLAARLVAARSEACDWTLDPYYLLMRYAVGKLTPVLLHGFPDIFYYVSADGKSDVREALAAQIIECIDPAAYDDPKSLISLTLLAHSAGALVAFDLTFYLFWPEGEREFLRGCRNPEVLTKLQKLRELAQNGRLRIRRLITFGSPISLIPYRNNDVVDLLAAGQRIDPALHGLLDNPEPFGEPLSSPRWINLWDKDDPFAWPAEPLMDNTSGALEDVYADVSDSVELAHNSYWRSRRVHRAIAGRW